MKEESKQFAYGSMYSNQSTIIYYLLRCAPSFFLKTQGSNYLTSICNVWDDANNQCKELKEAIPE